MTKKIITIIPARMASTRLPNKPLAIIKGKTMIQRVYEQALKANLGEVYIACDGENIANEIKKFTGNFVITDPALPSGTDRIFQAIQKLNLNAEFIVNLQGDLPLIDPQTISSCAQLAINSSCDIATVASVISNVSEVDNPNVVKIALSQNNLALYFSRCPIPFSKDPTQQYFHHIGIYTYRRHALEKFVNLSPSPLEKRESLEQLRALENNMKIAVKIVDYHPVSVDTYEDLMRAISLVNENEN